MPRPSASTDFAGLAHMAFGDADYQPIDIAEDYEVTGHWTDILRPLSGSKREASAFSHSLGMGVYIVEQIILLDVNIALKDMDPTTHTLSVEYENLDGFDAVCLDDNRIVTEIQEKGYDAAAASDRVVKALSAITDMRMGFGAI